MQTTLCSRCHKNVAVVFIQKLENGTAKTEGLCLKCAKELGIQPLEDMMQKMGISDEDLENLSNEMMTAMGSPENLAGLIPSDTSDDEDDEDGKTATFPFLNKLFGANQNSGGEDTPSGDSSSRPSREEKSRQE